MKYFHWEKMEYQQLGSKCVEFLFFFFFLPLLIQFFQQKKKKKRLFIKHDFIYSILHFIYKKKNQRFCCGVITRLLWLLVYLSGHSWCFIPIFCLGFTFSLVNIFETIPHLRIEEMNHMNLMCSKIFGLISLLTLSLFFVLFARGIGTYDWLMERRYGEKPPIKVIALLSIIYY